MIFWHHAHKYLYCNIFVSFAHQHLINTHELLKKTAHLLLSPDRSGSVARWVVYVLILLYIRLLLFLNLELSVIAVIFNSRISSTLNWAGTMSHLAIIFLFFWLLTWWLPVTSLVITFCNIWVSLFKFLTGHKDKGSFIVVIA